MKNYSKYLFLAILLFFITNHSLFGQNTTTTKIIGGVLDADGNGLPYATIQLLDTFDSTTLFGTITHESGLFSIDSVKANKYLIKVSCVGFKTVFRSKDLTHTKKESYLKAFTLNIDTVQLKGIEVKEKAEGYYEFANKTIFYPDSISLKSSKNALDLLNKLPEIQVNKRSQSISVMGNSNVLVLINGIDNHRLVKAIKPEDVEKIVLITHPSAKFRSDVTSVVNIVLKDKRKQGFSIFTDLSVALNQKNHYAFLQLAYSIKKWNFFVTYNGMLYRALTNDTLKRNGSDNGDEFTYLSTPLDKSVFDSYMHRIQYGIDFLPDKKTLISFTGQTKMSDYSFHQRQKTLYILNRLETEIRKNGMDSKDKSIQQNYSLYFKKNFSKRNALKLNSNIYFLHHSGHSFLMDTIFLLSTPAESISSRNEFSNYHQFSVTSRFDYEHNFSKLLKAEGGYQIYYRNIKSNIHSEEIANQLTYSEFRNAFYGTFNLELGKYGFEAGARFENSSVLIYDTIHHNYFKLLPSLSVVYKPKHHHTIRLSYNKRLKYPSVYLLNPYEFYSSDSSSFSSGNPYLFPENIHNFEATYSYKRKAMNLSVSLNYSIINDIVVQVYDISKNVVGSQYQNIGKANRFGVNFNAYFILFNFMETESYLYLKYNSFANNVEHNGFGYKGGISTYMSLPWDIDFDLTLIFGNKEVYYNGFSEENFLIDEISFSKDILNGNGSVGISVWEPFFKNIYREKIWSNKFKEKTISETTNNTSILIEFTYSINKGKKINKFKKELQMENNSKNAKR